MAETDTSIALISQLCHNETSVAKEKTRAKARYLQVLPVRRHHTRPTCREKAWESMQAEMTIQQQLNMSALIESIGLCGCGTNSTMDIVILVLEKSEKKECMYDAAVDAEGRWVEFAANILDDKGLLEHGGSIGFAWLSDKGIALLSFLRKYGTDRDQWPEEVKLGSTSAYDNGKLLDGDADQVEVVK